MAYLVLVRHGESEWNAKGLWTGWTDISLSEKGKEEARKAAEQMKDIHFDEAFTSKLKRAQQTLDEIKKILHCEDLPTYENTALNERDYGDLTGKNKWKIKEEFGEEQFNKWRRSFDEKPPNGESLHDVYDRVIPYYTKVILPQLEQGKNIIIAAHGNSLRALVKYLETISDEDIAKLEIATGEVYVYTIDDKGKITNKEIRKPQ
jgi:2,3-bisphosphoglycerate-dependent phosphoglycerate mutase